MDEAGMNRAFNIMLNTAILTTREAFLERFPIDRGSELENDIAFTMGDQWDVSKFEKYRIKEDKGFNPGNILSRAFKK